MHGIVRFGGRKCGLDFWKSGLFAEATPLYSFWLSDHMKKLAVDQFRLLVSGSTASVAAFAAGMDQSTVLYDSDEGEDDRGASERSSSERLLALFDDTDSEWEELANMSFLPEDQVNIDIDPLVPQPFPLKGLKPAGNRTIIDYESSLSSIEDSVPSITQETQLPRSATPAGNDKMDSVTEVAVPEEEPTQVHTVEGKVQVVESAKSEVMEVDSTPTDVQSDSVEGGNHDGGENHDGVEDRVVDIIDGNGDKESTEDQPTENRFDVNALATPNPDAGQTDDIIGPKSSNLDLDRQMVDTPTQLEEEMGKLAYGAGEDASGGDRDATPTNEYRRGEDTFEEAEKQRTTVSTPPIDSAIGCNGLPAYYELTPKEFVAPPKRGETSRLPTIVRLYVARFRSYEARRSWVYPAPSQFPPRNYPDGSVTIFTSKFVIPPGEVILPSGQTSKEFEVQTSSLGGPLLQGLVSAMKGSDEPIDTLAKIEIDVFIPGSNGDMEPLLEYHLNVSDEKGSTISAFTGVLGAVTSIDFGSVQGVGGRGGSKLGQFIVTFRVEDAISLDRSTQPMGLIGGLLSIPIDEWEMIMAEEEERSRELSELRYQKKENTTPALTDHGYRTENTIYSAIPTDYGFAMPALPISGAVQPTTQLENNSHTAHPLSSLLDPHQSQNMWLSPTDVHMQTYPQMVGADIHHHTQHGYAPGGSLHRSFDHLSSHSPSVSPFQHEGLIPIPNFDEFGEASSHVTVDPATLRRSSMSDIPLQLPQLPQLPLIPLPPQISLSPISNCAPDPDQGNVKPVSGGSALPKRYDEFKPSGGSEEKGDIVHEWSKLFKSSRMATLRGAVTVFLCDYFGVSKLLKYHRRLQDEKSCSGPSLEECIPVCFLNSARDDELAEYFLEEFWEELPTKSIIRVVESGIDGETLLSSNPFEGEAGVNAMMSEKALAKLVKDVVDALAVKRGMDPPSQCRSYKTEGRKVVTAWKLIKTAFGTTVTRSWQRNGPDYPTLTEASNTERERWLMLMTLVQRPSKVKNPAAKPVTSKKGKGRGKSVKADDDDDDESTVRGGIPKWSAALPILAARTNLTQAQSVGDESEAQTEAIPEGTSQQ